MDKLISNVKEWSGLLARKQPEEVTRSQYSLVSCGDLSPAALELWLGLPEEVKYDPALAPFRRFYEKEHGTVENITPSSKSRSTSNKRLPLVSSAPHLNNNLTSTNQIFDINNLNSLNNNNNVCNELPQWKKNDPSCENDPDTTHKPSKMARLRHCTKMSLLLATWMFFTLIFMMYSEKEVVTRQSSIAPGELKDYPIQSTEADLKVHLKLTGPFLSEQSEQKLNATEVETAAKMEVWMMKWLADGTVERTHTWDILIENDDSLDFSVGETRSALLKFHREANSRRTDNANATEATSAASEATSANATYALRMQTTSNRSLPFSMTYTKQPLDSTTGVLCSCVLLIGLYTLIIFEIINRTMAAVVVSTTSIAVLAFFGERPSLPELISWLDAETLLLLFSMMLLVAIMAETGMFDFLAVFTFEVTKGKMWPLINLLCAITALLSTFLDNVTTVLLMTPVTIRLCEVMELDPVPILMSMVMYSNIGGTATPVGDPPNVIIASNKAVVNSGINFTNFTMHMTVGILFVAVQTYLQLRFIYRDTNKLRLNVPADIQELRQQISIWRRAAESLPHLSKDQLVVRERLEKKIRKLNVQLEDKVKERTKRACPKDTFQKTLDEMKQKYKIRDVSLLVKATVAITFVVVVFFLHSIPELNRVSLAWTALLGAILLLILADREDLEPILHRVEWSTLLFFAALFVLMEALSKLGLIAYIGGWTEYIILSVDESYRLAVSLILMLWVSGLTSAFVDNIPLTTMMIRIVTSLGGNPNLGLPLAPLIWALSYGACLGGNGTLIGASANVVCAGVAEQHGYRITFMQFFKVGFPVMIGHLVVASCYLLVCHCVFTWH
ncbi:P protein [Plutella xylostella]|uniref:P protein n=1 Tax=Plutella xylostella TaxID=51655 RepID=UPI002032A202|nr:P protein [Plutella xylostella]